MGKERGSFQSWINQAPEASQTGLNARLLDSGSVFNLCSVKRSLCEIRSSWESPNGGWMDEEEDP